MVAIGNGLGNVGALEKSKLQTDEISVDFAIAGRIQQGNSLPDLLSGGNQKLSPMEKRFDINQDGKLDKAEKKAMDAYIKEKFDIDGNGQMDDFEKIAHNAYKEAKMFDFNKNGKLDPEEKAAFEAFKKAQTQKGDKKDGEEEPGKNPFPGITPFPGLNIGVGVGVGIGMEEPEIVKYTD